MHLVNVKIMHFLRAIFDDPVLDVTLMHDDIGNGRMWIEGRRRLAFDGEVELSGTVRVPGIVEFFGKIESACADGMRISEPKSSRCRRAYVRVGRDESGAKCGSVSSR